MTPKAKLQRRGIVVDSGFWFALFDHRDPYHVRAVELERGVLSRALLTPWPILYEVIGTRFVRNAKAITRFQKVLVPRLAILLDDSPYRERALNQCIHLAASGNRKISLVDMVTRCMLEDSTLIVTHLVTFNPKDFVDVCQRRSIEIES